MRAAQARQAVLIMIQGAEPGSIYKLPDNRVTTIGRSSRNLIAVVNPSVSRFHCEIAWINDCWVLADLHSRKGTMVNGAWATGRVALALGDLIRLSTTIFRFDLVDESAERDDGLLAIHSAMIDLELQKKGEFIGTLDDVMKRSQLDGESGAEDRELRRTALRANLTFLAAVTFVVTAGVTVALLWAHGMLPWPPAGGARQATEPSPPPPREEPDTPPNARPPAEVTRPDPTEFWTTLEKCFEAVSSHEVAGDYTAALAAYGPLGHVQAGTPAARVIAARRRQTVQLAYAFYEAGTAQAENLLAQGERREAARVFRSLAGKVGVGMLVSRARRRAEELE